MQSNFLALSCVNDGTTKIKENIFDNRFLIVEELKKMGAQIKIRNNKSVLVKGVKQLFGSTVSAKDLRGGASLVLAGLIAKGKTIVKNIHHIDRGYDRLEENLSSLGAKIKRR